MSRAIEVTPVHVAAARLQLLVDAKLGQVSSEVIRRIAEAKPVPPDPDSGLGRPA